jgi:hypothetical protein
MSKEDDYKTLFQKIALAGFPIEAITEVQTFQKSCLEAEDLLTAVQAEVLMSLIYFTNGEPEQSLEIDLQLAAKLPCSNKNYGLILLSSTKTSAFLKCTEKVLPYVLKFLREPQTQFNVTIPLL